MISKSKIWKHIKSHLFKPTSQTYIADGSKFSDLVGANRDYHIMTYKRLLNEYKYGDIDEMELLDKLTRAKESRTSHMMYRIKDVLHSFRIKTHESMNKYREKLGLVDHYTYEAKLEACKYCKAKDGKQWKSWSEIPNSDKPLIHHGCRCIIVSSKGRYSKELKALSADGWVKMRHKSIQSFFKKRAGLTLKAIRKSKLHIKYDEFIKLLYK